MQRRRCTSGLKEGTSVSVSDLAFILRLPLAGSGISNWPPIWVWTGGEKNERPHAEVGVLIKVELSLLDPRRLFLTIQYNDSEYMGGLLFDDAAVCRKIYHLLKGLYHHSISENGELDINHL